MLVLNENEVRNLLSLSSCINVLESVLADMANGQATQQLRTAISLENSNIFGLMPGSLVASNTMGAKVISVFPNNHERGLPSHQGVVLVFDSTNGSLRAIVDGTQITAVRTAAASAVATKYLARKDARVLAILGTGAQARTHLEAMLEVRPVHQVHVWSRNPHHAESFANEMRKKFAVSIEIFPTVSATVQDADIICTLTATRAPILDADWVKPGAHINAVGACTSSARELASNLVCLAEFYADSVESVLNESGDYLIPAQSGLINAQHIRGEIGEVITNRVPGRSSEESITVFESLGLAIEDLAVANFLYQEAAEKERGVWI